MSFRQKLVDELRTVGAATLYFGCWLAALVSLKFLILAEYNIEFSGISSAVIGALILAKVVAVLEHVSLGDWVRKQPGWVEVVLRTSLYVAGLIVLLLLEKAFDARHEYGSFRNSMANIFRHTDINHVWANVICLSGALLSYNLLSVIRRHLGKGHLRSLFMLPVPEEH